MCDELLPEWATAYSSEYQTLSQLCTKDGRVTGNAHIFHIAKSEFTGDNIYCVITEVGNITKYSLQELKERFHTPKYILHPKAPLRECRNNYFNFLKKNNYL